MSREFGPIDNETKADNTIMSESEINELGEQGENRLADIEESVEAELTDKQREQEKVFQESIAHIQTLIALDDARKKLKPQSLGDLSQADLIAILNVKRALKKIEEDHNFQAQETVTDSDVLPSVKETPQSYATDAGSINLETQKMAILPELQKNIETQENEIADKRAEFDRLFSEFVALVHASPTAGEATEQQIQELEAAKTAERVAEEKRIEILRKYGRI